MSDNERNPIDLLAEEFAERLRAGQQPTIEEYAARCPEHAAMIRAVFPSIEMVERVSEREDQYQKADSRRPSSLFSSIPQSLGDFDIVREIGRGGMGVVYEAIQRSLKRHVALKVVMAIDSGSAKQQARFRREAEAAAGLHHTNIVPVYGIGEDQGFQYYTMQLIDGVTLHDVIQHLKRNGPSVSAQSETPPSNTGSVGSNAAAASPASKIQFDTAQAAGAMLGLASSTLPRAASLEDIRISEQTTQDALPIAITEELSFDTHVDDVSQLEVSQLEVCQPENSGTLETGQRKAPKRSPKVRLGSQYFRNVARLIANVADALQYAHHQGVLHRDIKPGNLLLDRDGTVWVTDFGLACKSDFENATQSGEIVGTLRYMAPEQLRGDSDSRSDIYGLGITLYELLTLEAAWGNPNQVLNMDRRDPIRNLRSIRSDVPPDLETITLKACATEPSGRYQTAAEFEEDLERFLEDRPILARRTSSIERLWRWSKRNPAVASLSAATLMLLVSVAALLAIGYSQKQAALIDIRKQFERAEQNLTEKTEALDRVSVEHTRAETNLELAIQAFNAVANNIASRGAADALMSDQEDDEEIAESADATLSPADVELMETLLGFFDRFSAENAKDLSVESADARRRVGDIQQRLGQLDDAERSYRQALEAYKRIAQRKPDEPSLVFAQASVLRELMVTAAKRGQLPRVWVLFLETRKLLENQAAIRSSSEGRFELAITLNSLAALGTRRSEDGPGGARNGVNPLGNRQAGRNATGPLPAAARLRQEADANREALEILQALVSEDSKNMAYRTALGRTFRDEVRIAIAMRDSARAEKALEAAIDIFSSLQIEHASSDAFKYELAYTLGTRLGFPAIDLQRLIRAQRLSRELVVSRPSIAEYNALLAAILNRIGTIHMQQRRLDRADASLSESIGLHKNLAQRFPDVEVYQLKLVQSLQQYARLNLTMSKPESAKENLDFAIQTLERFRQSNRIGPRLQNLIKSLREQRSEIS